MARFGAPLRKPSRESAENRACWLARLLQRTSLRTHLPWVLMVLLVLACLAVDQETNEYLPPVNQVRLLLDLLVGAGAVVAVRRPTLLLGAATAAVSVGVSVALAAPGGGPAPGSAEVLGQLVIVCAGLRYLRPVPALALAVMMTGSVTTVGLLRVAPGADPASTVGDVMVMVLVAAVLGLLWRTVATERLRAAQEARTEERLALSRDLHDSLASQLTGLSMNLQAIRVLKVTDVSRLMEAVSELELQSQLVMDTLKELVLSLRDDPSAGQPSPDGLQRALDTAVTTHPLAVLDSRLPPDEQYPAETVAAAEAVVREALVNCRRHASGATQVRVTARRLGDQLELVVDDDADTPSSFSDGSHYGLIGLSERVTLAGGQLESGPLPEGGWRLRACLPASDGGKRS